MKNRYCNMCNKPLLIEDKITTKNKEFLSVVICGIEHNWCDDNCYEKWYEKEVDNNVAYVKYPYLHFKD